MIISSRNRNAVTIERKVLEQVRPTEEQLKKLENVTRDLCARVRDIGQYFDIPVEPFVAGSVAKRTHLRDPDVDIFMLFPPALLPLTLPLVTLVLVEIPAGQVIRPELEGRACVRARATTRPTPGRTPSRPPRRYLSALCCTVALG